MKQIIICFSLLICTISFAQNKKSTKDQIDLFGKILQAKSITSRQLPDTISKIPDWNWNTFSNTEFNELKKQLNKKVDQASKDTDKYNIQHIILNAAIARQDLGESVINGEICIELAKKIDDPLVLAKMYNKMAGVLSSFDLWWMAIQYSEKALHIIDSLGDKELIEANHFNHGFLYKNCRTVKEHVNVRDSAVRHVKIAFDILKNEPLKIQEQRNFEEKSLVYSMVLARNKQFDEAVRIAKIGYKWQLNRFINSSKKDHWIVAYLLRFSQHIADYYVRLDNRDSSFHYFKKAEIYQNQLKSIQGVDSNIWNNDTYSILELEIEAYDHFGEYKKAGQLLDLAYDSLNSPNLANKSYHLEYLKYLGCKVYEHDGQFEKAVSSYKFIQNLKDSTNKVDSQNRYKAEEVRSEILIRLAKENHQKEIDKQKLIRNGMGVGLSVLFVFTGIFFYQRNKTKKALKRSDELLLNILPAEVAEELKAKGSAEAKLFDDVTVMFTDFQNFTQISERLSPTELVAEIHQNFEAFDKIIGKHNIEKIKTIGDAYMCVGGLPKTNNTNALDVVKAGIEIQNYVQQQIEIRKKEGKPFFEIRIGIHTGPVVAGIVGVKKFAYDIWGDTVNTASRMESSGEVGKVNISGTTYELVKNQFNCVYRGKIEAKGKGEIDMYFVE